MKYFKLIFTAPTENGLISADYRLRGKSATQVIKIIIRRYPGAVFTVFEEL